ncbi:MAG TPA: cupin domain-containing protein [Candidatus Deferrimicrobiaceae bacterium]|nr:cupin domain-containing protein [Candidatus Deferrimicrobiaceae bacterium]
MGPEEIVAAYRLERHPEGGWFREVHRSSCTLDSIPGYPGPRPAFTAIYFLLPRGDFSAFHRLRSEETWIHIAGDPLELILLGEEVRRIKLGLSAEGGDPIAVVPAGVLQAARSLGEFTLSACIVAPGFDFADFSIPDREDLLRKHPGRKDLILSFTR